MTPDPNKITSDVVERVEEVLQAAYNGNQPFNEAFNGDSPIEIPTLDPAGDSYRLEASEVLFWADRDAYNNELVLWRDGIVQETHRDAVELIEQSHQVPIFCDLVAAIRRHRIVPFVGAGLSQSCKTKDGTPAFPLWGKALSDLASRIPGHDQGQFSVAHARGDYIAAAQCLWEADETQVRNYIRNMFDKSLCEKDKISGAALLLPKISRGCVITTNFDAIIESVMGPFEGYMHGLQPGNRFVPKLMRGDRCILKLHGDAEDHQSFVFTAQQYLAGYGNPFDFSKPLPRSLRQIFISESLLFLGCSLEQDRTLALFDQVAQSGRDRNEHFELPDHFAIVPEPDILAGRSVKEARLAKLNIRPLWYPSGQHIFVERFLNLAIATIDGQIKAF